MAGAGLSAALCFACVVVRCAAALADGHESGQGGRVFELSSGGGEEEGGEGFLLGEGDGKAAEEQALGKDKVAFDFDVEQAAKEDVRQQNERKEKGEPEYIPAPASPREKAKHALQRDFSDKQLSTLGSIFSERASDVGANKDGAVAAMKPVETDAANYVDPKEVEKYRDENAVAAAQVELESALDSTYRHQQSSLGKEARVQDDGDMLRKWVLPTDEMPPDEPTPKEEFKKEQVNEKRLNEALKKAHRIKRAKRPTKLLHRKQSYRKKLDREVNMLRYGSIHKLLRLRHRFMLKEAPTLEETKQKDALQQIIDNDQREVPEQKYEQNIDSEIKEVTETIQETKKPDPKQEATAKLKSLDAAEPKCRGNSKPDGFVAEQLKPLAQGTLSTQVVITSCDDVARAGLCRSKRGVKVVMNATTMPHLEAKHAIPKKAYSSSYSSESAGGANPAKTYPLKYLMSIWCELSCHYGACDNRAEQIMRNYTAKVARSPLGQRIADDKLNAKADFNTQNLIFQIEKDRADRLSRENAEEMQAKSVKRELDHQAEIDKEKSIKVAVTNQTHGGIGGGRYDLAAYQAKKITEYLTSLKFLKKSGKSKEDKKTEIEAMPMEREEEIWKPAPRRSMDHGAVKVQIISPIPKKQELLLSELDID